jgi:hypothetical protein
MSQQAFLDSSLSRLNELLTRQFGAAEPDFAGQAQSVGAELPEDLGQALRKLAVNLESLRAQAEPPPSALAEFAFRCGELYSKLESHRQIQLELENVVVGPETVSANPLQSGQADRLAGFIEARDRVFRKVADFTLKALLIGLGLLTLGLFLGVI